MDTNFVVKCIQRTGLLKIAARKFSEWSVKKFRLSRLSAKLQVEGNGLQAACYKILSRIATFLLPTAYCQLPTANLLKACSLWLAALTRPCGRGAETLSIVDCTIFDVRKTKEQSFRSYGTMDGFRLSIFSPYSAPDGARGIALPLVPLKGGNYQSLNHNSSFLLPRVGEVGRGRDE
jgi:hypothetical protein